MQIGPLHWATVIIPRRRKYWMEEFDFPRLHRVSVMRRWVWSWCSGGNSGLWLTGGIWSRPLRARTFIAFHSSCILGRMSFKSAPNEWGKFLMSKFLSELRSKRRWRVNRAKVARKWLESRWKTSLLRWKHTHRERKRGWEMLEMRSSTATRVADSTEGAERSGTEHKSSQAMNAERCYNSILYWCRGHCISPSRWRGAAPFEEKRKMTDNVDYPCRFSFKDLFEWVQKKKGRN